MAITLQALQADGAWATRNAFVTENKQVVIGAMKAADLEAKARQLMAQWQATMQDGKQLRVHNSDKDPEPTARKREEEAGRTVRPQVLKARQCFFCGTGIGLMTDDDYDDLDTCGARACTREARIESRERREEDIAYAGT